jgi:hypothetical protein
VAPHLPEWLKEMHRPERFAPGCYCVGPRRRSFLWIAANSYCGRCPAGHLASGTGPDFAGYTFGLLHNASVLGRVCPVRTIPGLLPVHRYV